MVFQRRFTAAVTLGGLAVLSFTLAGCGGGGGGGGTPPAASPPASPAITSHFSRQITFDDFQPQIPPPPGVRRVEIEIDPASLPGPAGLKALEVEIKEPAEVADEEEIKSRIVDINTTPGTTGTITLEVGNLQVDFNAATEFKDDRSSSTKLTFDQFVAAVQAALDNEESPLVEVERPATNPPQAPDDPTFVATEIKLVGEGDIDEPEIEINVDADNLEMLNLGAAPGAVLGVLRVLNLPIEIVNGVTELQEEIKAGEVEDFPDAVVEFEDRVVAPVDVAARTFTLASGIVVHVPTDGMIDQFGDLLTLQAVADSVAAGNVRAEGDATVAAVGPPVRLETTDVKFEVDQ